MSTFGNIINENIHFIAQSLLSGQITYMLIILFLSKIVDKLIFTIQYLFNKIVNQDLIKFNLHIASENNNYHEKILRNNINKFVCQYFQHLIKNISAPSLGWTDSGDFEYTGGIEILPDIICDGYTSFDMIFDQTTFDNIISKIRIPTPTFFDSLKNKTIKFVSMRTLSTGNNNISITETDITMFADSIDTINLFIQLCVLNTNFPMESDKVTDIVSISSSGHDGSKQEQVTMVLIQKNYSNAFLSKDNEEILIKNLKDWNESKKYYTTSGLPYKIGFLLYGKPGCGKSSIIVAAAQELNMDIFKINLKNMKSYEFLEKMSRVRNSVVLFEDIDINNVTHSRINNKQTKHNKKSIFCDNNVTLDDMFTVLDGYNYLHGCVVFMTTNHIEKLDPALIRSGRIDHIMEFKLCDSHQFTNIFKYFVGISYTDVDPKYKFPEEKYSTSHIINTVIVPNRQHPEKILQLLN